MKTQYHFCCANLVLQMVAPHTTNLLIQYQKWARCLLTALTGLGIIPATLHRYSCCVVRQLYVISAVVSSFIDTVLALLLVVSCRLGTARASYCMKLELCLL